MFACACAQSEALEAVKSIEVSGVTNLSAGIFTAIDQFNVAFAKRCVTNRIKSNMTLIMVDKPQPSYNLPNVMK